MKAKKTAVWSLIHGRAHSSLRVDEQRICDFMGLFGILFPGIDYFSLSGFHTVRLELVMPTLKKLFPELVTMEENEVTNGEVEIVEFLPSEGYEWQKPDWQEKFKKLLCVD